MKNKTLWILGPLAVVTLIVYFSIPSVVKTIIAHKVEGIVVKDVSWSFTSIDLNNISIDRAEAQGAITNAHVKFSWDGLNPSVKDIQIHGGNLTVLKKETPENTETENNSNKIIADKLKELSVSIIELDKVNINHKYGNINIVKPKYYKDFLVVDGSGHNRKSLIISADKVVISPSSVMFGELNISNVEYSFETEYLDIDAVYGSLIDIDIPGLSKGKLEFIINGAKINLALKRADIVSVFIPSVGIAKNITLSVFDTKPPFFSIDKFHSEHTWFPTYIRHIVGSVGFNGDFWIDVGGVKTKGNYKKLQVTGSGSCVSWNESIMTGVNDTIYSHAVEPPLFKDGSIEFEIDPTNLKFNLKQDCKAVCSHPLMRQLRSKFAYSAYSPDGKSTSMRITGKRHIEWAQLSLISPEVREAFITLEDPSFKSHNGIVMASVIASLKKNIKLGRLHIGGSTITQQLAKNIWLTRDKNIVRKTKEALLTWALEDCFTKDEILELYLNVVEFGPNTYGILNGARHHFNKSFVDLTKEEAFYLASILPRPNSALPPGDLSRTKNLISRVTNLLNEN